MTRLAELRFDGASPVPVAHLSGELDLSNVRDIGDALAQGVPAEATGLVADLSELRHIDSAGVRMLFELRRQLLRRRQSLALVVPERARIRDVLALAAVDQAVTVETGVEAAVAAVRAGADA